MAGTLDSIIAGRLQYLDANQLRRKLPEQTECREILDFGSNDYLGLSREPWMAEAAAAALLRHGTGAGASRLLTSGSGPHLELEDALADWKKTGAALCFSSGYNTAIGTLSAVLSREDTVVLDKLCHASLIDGARLSGARVRIFPHNNLNALEKLLQRSRSRNSYNTILIVTEGVFSMDGDRAPLREMVEMKNRYGAVLMVDEAHSAGIFGSEGRGLATELGVSDQVEIQMGTLSKAFGCSGGYICGSRTLIDWMINKARSFVYSTAPAPAMAGAAHEALRWMRSESGARRRAELHSRMELLNTLLRRAHVAESPIFPIAVPGSDEAVRASQRLLADGYRIPAIRYPTVARGRERLRLTVTARHSEGQILSVHQAIKTF